MNKFVKISLILVSLIVIIAIIVYLKLFVIGSKDYQNILVNKVTVSEKSVVIDMVYTDSSVSYKDYSYTLVGTELYVTVNSVLSNRKNNTGEFKVDIPVNGLDVNNIYLSDNKSAKVIYSK